MKLAFQIAAERTVIAGQPPATPSRARRSALPAALLSGAVASLLTAALAAQTPELGYVFPPAVRAGTTADVRLGGYDFTDDMQFFVHHSQVKLTALSPPGAFLVPGPPYWFGPKGFANAWPIPREIEARVEAPAGLAPGLVRWQVANANGASPTGVLLVSDIPEAVESRQDDQSVQPLPDLPVAVSGRLGAISQVDRYRITPAEDGPVTLDLWARRLGSDFNAVIEVRDADGAVVADIADTQGLDPRLTFAARGGAPYEVRLFDVDFRGNRAFVYRLAARAAPHVVARIPLPAATGKPRESDVVFDNGQRLEVVRRSGDSDDDEGQATRLPLVIYQAQPISSPCRVVRRYEGADQQFVLTAAKGQRWKIAVNSLSRPSRYDFALEVIDAGGKTLAANDDTDGALDPVVEFTAPADGAYRCTVREQSGAAPSLAAVYQWSAEHLRSGFSLSTAQRVGVAVGGKASLSIKAARHGGFADEIAIDIRGLPAGVTVPEGLKIEAKQNELKVPLAAADDAGTTARVLRIVGTAVIDGQPVERPALAAAAGNLCPRSASERLTESVLLTVTMKAPVQIALVDKNRQRAVHRGTTYPAPFLIRREPGFEGEVRLQMAAKQSRHRQGIRGPILTVPADADEALYPCFMPEWLATDRTTRMSVVGVVQVADPQGRRRSLMAAADARITMILEGALLKVAHQTGDVTLRPGQPLDIPLEISRSAKLREAATVTLEVPAHLRGKLRAEPLTVASGQQQALLRVETTDDSALLGDQRLLVKATALQDGRWPVVSQIEVPVRFGDGE